MCLDWKQTSCETFDRHQGWTCLFFENLFCTIWKFQHCFEWLFQRFELLVYDLWFEIQWFPVSSLHLWFSIEVCRTAFLEHSDLYLLYSFALQAWLRETLKGEESEPFQCTLWQSTIERSPESHMLLSILRYWRHQIMFEESLDVSLSPCSVEYEMTKCLQSRLIVRTLQNCPWISHSKFFWLCLLMMFSIAHQTESYQTKFHQCRWSRSNPWSSNLLEYFRSFSSYLLESDSNYSSSLQTKMLDQQDLINPIFESTLESHLSKFRPIQTKNLLSMDLSQLEFLISAFQQAHDQWVS